MEDALHQPEMGKTTSRIFNRRTIALIAGIIIILAAGFVAVQRLTHAQAATANVQTVPVQTGTLQATVNTAGNVTPAEQVTLNFQTSGQVKTVNVQVGDQVKAGQVLASLDTSNLQLQVANAQSALATAQAQLEQTKAGPTAADLAAAQAAVQSAQDNLAKVKAGPTRDQIAAAQAQLKAAQDNYNTVVAGPDPNTIQQDQLKLQQAKDALYAAQGARDAAGRTKKSNPAQYDQAQAQVLQNEIAVQLAQQTLTNDQKPPTVDQIQTALGQVKTAQDNLNTLLASPTAADLSAAQSQLAQAQDNLAKLTQGPTDQALAIAQAGVDQANNALQQAELQLQQAQLVAPFDGTVTDVSITPGQTAGASTNAIGLADMNHLVIDGQLDEIDVPKVKIGQSAQITLDALPGQTLTGKVTEVAPAGAVQQGVVNYPVTVSLVNPDPAVKPGMTASVNIVVAERQNVLEVPNRAIHFQCQRAFVTVLVKGQLIQTPVQTGLSNDTMTEITSGLKEGDEVVVNGTTTTQPRGVPGGGFGGGFGGIGR
jgi:HlyD family secretion protein